VLHLIPSGILRDSVTCYIGNGVVRRRPRDRGNGHAAGRRVDVASRLKISEACPLIMPHHVRARPRREIAQGRRQDRHHRARHRPRLRGQGARRALRLQDLFHRERFAAKLGEVLDHHNFMLEELLQADTVDFNQSLDEMMGLAERLKPMVADVPRAACTSQQGQARTCCSRARRHPARHRPRHLPVRDLVQPAPPAVPPPAPASAPNTLHYVLGITKGLHHARRFRPVPHRTVRRRRPVSRREGPRNSAPPPDARAAAAGSTRPRSSARSRSGGPACARDQARRWTVLETVRVCVGYKIDGEVCDILPVGADSMRRSSRFYEDLPGWSESTVRRAGIRQAAAEGADLPEADGSLCEVRWTWCRPDRTGWRRSCVATPTSRDVYNKPYQSKKPTRGRLFAYSVWCQKRTRTSTVLPPLGPELVRLPIPPSGQVRRAF